MGLSLLGFTRPLEGIVAVPVNFVTGILNTFTRQANNTFNETNNIDELKRRNRELEEQLALLTAELIQLREVASDAERLAALLSYTRTTTDQSFVTADVIGYDTQSSVRSIIINKGTRDGVAIGMPVITELGLVGRIYDVTANYSIIQLVTDANSSVSARLETSRAEGSVIGRGLDTGNLRMQFIPVDSEIIVGDLVYTSGLGGNFPPDLVIGQVTSFTNLEFELTQEAQISSLIDFKTLELVLVVTSFEPADISVFDEAP